MAVKACPEPIEIAEYSMEEFITEHYYGYTKKNERTTYEYRVEHPKWKVYPVQDYLVDVQFGKLYGSRFSFLDQQTPDSVLLAEGSEVSVAHKVMITKKQGHDH